MNHINLCEGEIAFEREPDLARSDSIDLKTVGPPSGRDPRRAALGEDAASSQDDEKGTRIL